MPRRFILVAILATVTPSATALAQGADTAIAALHDANGAEVGMAMVATADGGLLLSLAVDALPPGVRGAHVHMTGRCDAPDFESAGDHWNPTDAQHGLDNPQGPHAGDMPNLTVDENGRGALEYLLPDATLDELMDADGAAIVVHAAEDDQVTDPAGDSGDRIACGVFAN